MGKQASKKQPESFLEDFQDELATEFSSKEGRKLTMNQCRRRAFKLLEEREEQLAYWIEGSRFDPRKGGSLEDFYLAIEVLEACCL